jgi:hypothetical protein
MMRLLTFAEVRAVLGLASDRQVRRLLHDPDPLPVRYLNRKEPRVLEPELAAWIARRPLTGGLSAPYRSACDRHDDRDGVADAAHTGGAVAGDARGEAGGALEHPGALGAGRVAHSRRGRPLDSIRLRPRAS